MNKIFGFAVVMILVLSVFNVPTRAEAKGGAYYKSASTGRFATKSSYRLSPSTVYRSYRR
ncbi:MAG TPA: hypothetical protein VFQ72_00530 [Candidatus Paceibacterota bacterium]|nr:hypothetical protein [Candidatus Paceibacterota bacterium]